MDRVGGYELEELIGRGGMGEVWRAHDLARDREVALKLLPTSLSEDPEYRRRFQRESHLVARLREPHLIPIHDYGEIDGRLFIDMRLVEGRSLQDLLEDEGGLDAGRTIALLAQIAEALDAAHVDGLVHRDVKPSNVLVTPSDFVYVVDFGLAYVVGTPGTRLTMTGTTMGTLEYMAPERFSRRLVDGRTDVYSLACVLFECLTTEKPFPGDLPTQMYGHLNDDPPRPSERGDGIPAALDAVVARGMAKDPEDRFPTAGALVAAARAAVRTAPGGPARPTLVPPPARSSPGIDPAAVTRTIVPAGPRPDGGARSRGGAALALARPPAGPGGGARPPAPRDPHPSGPTPGRPLPELREPPRSPGARRLRRVGLPVLAGLLALVAVVVVLATTLGGTTPTPRPAPVAAGPVPTVAGTIPVGPAPIAAAVAPDGRFAYVVSQDARAITVVDTARGTATGTIPVPGGGPRAVAFSPDGRRAYVGVVGDTAGEVGVVDTATGGIVARIPTATPPLALAVAPDGGRVYASEPDAGAVTVIDAAADAVVGRVPITGRPHGLSLSPDGTRLAVADHDSDQVTLVDTAGDLPVATIPVGNTPNAVAWRPDGALVFDTNFDADSVSVTDPAGGRVVATVPTAVHPQAVVPSADGRYAYVAAIDANVVQVLDTTTFAVTATIPTGRGPSSVAVAPDGRTAYVTDLLDGTLTVLNVARP